MKNNNK